MTLYGTHSTHYINLDNFGKYQITAHITYAIRLYAR